MYSVDKEIYIDICSNGDTGTVIAEDVLVNVCFAYDDVDDWFYVSTIYDVNEAEVAYPLIKICVERWLKNHEHELFEQMEQDNYDRD